MELFTLLCETCAAKLKVTQPNAVGQVLACPKCQNMIKVVPPPGWTPPPEVQASLSAEDLKKLESLTNSTNFEDIDSILATPVLHQSPVGRPVKPKPKKKPLPAPKPANPNAEPILPTGQWTSEESQKRHKMLLFIAGILGSVIIAGAIIAYVVNRQPAVAENDTRIEQPKDAADATNAQSEKAASDTNSNSPDSTTNDGAAKKTDSDESEVVQPDESEIESVAPPLQDDTPDAVVEMPPELTTDPPPEIPDATPKPPIAANPLAGLLGDEDQSDAGQKTDDLIDRDVFGNPIRDDSRLGTLSGLLNQANTSIRAIRNLADAVRDEETIGLAKYYIEKPKKVEIDLSRLEWPCDGMIYEDVPVPSFFRDVTALTGVPIAFDAQACSAQDFDFKLKSPLRMQSSKSDRKTFTIALNQVLKESGLAAEPVDGKCIVVKPVQSSARVVVDYPVPDFATDATPEMMTFIKTNIAPMSWGQEGEPASMQLADNVISISQTPEIHRQLRDFFKKLNAIAQSNLDPAEVVELAELKTRWSSAKEIFAAPPNNQRTLPISLGGFCARLEKSSGMTVLVDWPAAIAEGWHPAIQVPGNIKENTVGETVRELARAMNLTVKVINPTTVELTSFESAANSSELEVFYYGDLVPQRFTREQLTELINRTLSAEFRSNADNIRMDFVPHLKCIVSVAPQTVQRQLEAIMNTMHSLK